MELSKRLQAVANLVTAGYRIADIGTDHAYIPIYLVENQIAPSAIAMDINRGPVERAREHVLQSGLDGRIDVRLSDGMKNLMPQEADAAVIAGMGGSLMMKILKESWDVTVSLKECILQPQSEIARFRTFLLEKGFFILQEEMVLDDGKYYPMMKAAPPSCDTKMQQGWSKTELLYGKKLLEMQHPVLRRYLEKEERRIHRILEGLEGQSSEKTRQRRGELTEELELVRKGMEYYEV